MPLSSDSRQDSAHERGVLRMGVMHAMYILTKLMNTLAEQPDDSSVMPDSSNSRQDSAHERSVLHTGVRQAMFILNKLKNALAERPNDNSIKIKVPEDAMDVDPASTESSEILSLGSASFGSASFGSASTPFHSHLHSDTIISALADQNRRYKNELERYRRKYGRLGPKSKQQGRISKHA